MRALKRLVLGCTMLATMACGRVGFVGTQQNAEDASASIDSDERPDVLSDVLLDVPEVPTCFGDDFDDGDPSDWTQLRGTWSVTEQDGRSALTTNEPGTSVITHPELRGDGALEVELDFIIDAPMFGDFSIYFASGVDFYRIDLRSMGSDNPTDEIVVRLDGATRQLASRPSVNDLGTWTRVRARRTEAGNIDVWVGGAPYLATTDSQISEPNEIRLGFWDDGRVDDVQALCER